MSSRPSAESDAVCLARGVDGRTRLHTAGQASLGDGRRSGGVVIREADEIVPTAHQLCADRQSRVEKFTDSVNRSHDNQHCDSSLIS